MNRSVRRYLLLFLLSATAVRAVAADDKKQPTLDSDQLGSTRNVHLFGKILLCGQPGAADLALAKKRGIKVVVTLRQPGEVKWDEAAAVKRLGLEFHRFAIGRPDTLTTAIFDGSLRVLANAKKSPVLLHCASANRVGAIWLAHRVVNDGLALEAARKEAKTVGLRTAGYEEKALAYIKSKQTTKSKKTNKIGLDVGEKAPDFALQDQDNNQQSLKKLLKNGPVAVVFHRSANW